MERRFELRLDELLADADLPPAVLRGLLPRLEPCLQPFAQRLQRSEQRANARAYVAGLRSPLRRKNAESIAYHNDQERQALQKFLGQAPWDHRPLLTELARQIGQGLGEADAVLVFDPSAFPKHGTASVGVQRQWCGRLGKIANCQVGIYLGSVARAGPALVDVRLYLPQAWAKDKKRRQKAGVPRGARFHTRHQLALAMVDGHGPLLPHAWLTGDDEMGRSRWFRPQLRQRQERYLLAVPSNTAIRDLAAAPPPKPARGPRPQVPFAGVQRWCAALPGAAWSPVEVRDGEQGPLVTEAVKARVVAKTDRRRAGPEEVLVIFRERQREGSWKHDYYLAGASWEAPLAEFARVAKAGHRVGEGLKRAKGEAGLADYEVRTWRGWHHHQALALIATRFLTQETRRGKKMDAGVDGTPTRGLGGPAVA